MCEYVCDIAVCVILREITIWIFLVLGLHELCVAPLCHAFVNMRNGTKHQESDQYDKLGRQCAMQPNSS